jgi:hypothetical protein
MSKATEPKKLDYVLVDIGKRVRAQDMVKLLGLKAKTPEEEELQDKYSKLLAEKDVDLKDFDLAVKTLYVMFGGLVRTPEKQAKADKKKADIKAKTTGKGNAKKDDDEDDEDADEDAGDDDEE